MLKFLLLVALLAIAVYYGIRLLQGERPGRSRPAPRPLAPDDDPEFLRDLDRKRRQRGETDT